MAMNSILNNYSGLTMSINSSSNMVSLDNFNLMKTPCNVDSNTNTPIIFVRGEVLNLRIAAYMDWSQSVSL